MTAENQNSRWLNKVGAFALASLFGALLAGWPFAHLSFESEFQAALTQIKPSSEIEIATHSRSVPIAGTEDFWLGRTEFKNPSTHPVALTSPLEIGDQVSISSNGKDQVLTVVDISNLRQTEAMQHLDSGFMHLVTLQERTETGVNGAVMRIIVETDNAELMQRRLSVLNPHDL